MQEIRLREAFFSVVPIKNIVGQGDRLAFHIVVTVGELVGTCGPVADAVPNHAGNEATYESAPGAEEGRRKNWLQRLLIALKF